MNIASDIVQEGAGCSVYEYAASNVVCVCACTLGRRGLVDGTHAYSELRGAGGGWLLRMDIVSDVVQEEAGCRVWI
jgi:hypothetical protein